MLKYNHVNSLRSLWEYKLNTKKIQNQEQKSIVDSAINYADILKPFMKIPNAGKFSVTELLPVPAIVNEGGENITQF